MEGGAPAVVVAVVLDRIRTPAAGGCVVFGGSLRACLVIAPWRAIQIYFATAGTQSHRELSGIIMYNFIHKHVLHRGAHAFCNYDMRQT